LSQPSNEVLLKCDEIGKKFSKNLKSSLKYAISDIAKDTLGKVFPKKEFSYCLRKDEFWALKSISFELRRGECLGLLGSNGAGKSTLLRILSGIIKQDKGSFSINGSIGGIIALGAGFNPILSGRENLSVYAAIKGISQNTLKAKEQEIIEFSEIGEFIDAPFRTYSSGMQVRLAFSAAAILEVPDILLIDEVLAVGDISFIGKCYDYIEKIKNNSAIILVSHNSYNIKRFCNRCIIVDKGTIIKDSRNVADSLCHYESEVIPQKAESKNLSFRYKNEVAREIFIEDSDDAKIINIHFEASKNIKFIELSLHDESKEPIVSYYNCTLRNRPVIDILKLNGSTINVNLSNFSSGNYSFSISFMDQELIYKRRLPFIHDIYIANETVIRSVMKHMLV